MIRAILLVFEPFLTWERIQRSSANAWSILLTNTLPLLIAGAVLEAYALVNWGEWQTMVNRTKLFPVGEAVVYVTAQALVMLFVILVSAWVIRALASTFRSVRSYSLALTTAAYGISPLLLVSMFNFVPILNLWAIWAVGILISVRALYHGLPRIMEPEPINAFGLFVSSALILVVTSGLARFLLWWYLRGNMKQVENWFSELAARLPL
jgi:uncharacterized membrane protein YidH (DUF202 family)